MIIYKQYNLSKSKDLFQFKKLKVEFLELISSAYGQEYFGDEIYERKILKRNLIILCAINIDSNEKLLGVLLIKNYEKLSGLAVLKEYRRRGIATALLQKAMNDSDYLYGEVATKSEHMKLFFIKLGFKMVNNEDIIKSLLFKQKDDVFFVDRSSEYISYIHAKDKRYIDRQVKFMIFEYERP